MTETKQSKTEVRQVQKVKPGQRVRFPGGLRGNRSARSDGGNVVRSAASAGKTWTIQLEGRQPMICWPIAEVEVAL